MDRKINHISMNHLMMKNIDRLPKRIRTKMVSRVAKVFLVALTIQFLFSMMPNEVTAQVLGTVNLSMTEVDQLSKEQIQEIIREMQSQGLSLDDVLAKLEDEGLTMGESVKLRTRLIESGVSATQFQDVEGSGDVPNFSTDETDETANAGATGNAAQSGNLRFGEVVAISVNGTDTNGAQPDGLVIGENGNIGEDSRVFGQTENGIQAGEGEDTTSGVSPMEDPIAGGGANIYGHTMFRDQSIDIFTTTDGARAPDWYVIGTGDQVRITIFGVSQADLLLEVSDEGYVQPTGMPRIFLKGLTIAQASRLLRERLSDFYTFEQEQFSLTIAVARTITVNMFGEVRSKGSFTVSALNTALNVLSVAGGPTSIGSVRSIQRIRGEDRTEIDLYTFLSDPSVQTGYDLRHNDVLFLPVVEKVVSLGGSVKRPMQYELKGEEGLQDLLRYAGGINYNTAPNYIQIQRMEGGEPRLYEYDLQEVMLEKRNLPLYDGDNVRVRTVAKPLERFVEVLGAVYYQGLYDLEENRSLRTLLEKAELRPGAVREKAMVERVNDNETISFLPVELSAVLSSAQEFELEAEDRVQIFTQSEYRDLMDIEISGSVRSPVSIPLELGEGLRLADALFMAGGLQPTAASAAFVFRREMFNTEIMDHIRVDVTRDADFELLSGDRLVVYDQRDYTNLGELAIGGAVNRAMSVVFDPELTVDDLLLMAGGVTQRASLNRVDVFRLDVSFLRGTSYEIITLEIDDSLRVVSAPENFQLQPYDRVIVRNIPEFNINATVQLNGEVRYAGTYPLESQKIRLSDVINEAGGLTSGADTKNAIIFRSFQGVGPIAVDLEKALSATSETDRDNPILFNGDVITIPKAQNTVTIRLLGTGVGELQSIGVVDRDTELGGNRDINVIYRGGKSARWYIREFAGGFAREADKWSVTVTRPNGEVSGTRRSVLFFRNYPTVEPGSTITLRYKAEEPLEEEELINWEEVQARSIQFTTTILTLLILVDRLNGN